MYYVAVAHKEADSAYGVHFPDVPGCYSAADTLGAVVAEAREALSLFFEDGPVIEPRDLDEIKASGEVDQDLAEGATLVLVPFIPVGGKKVRANVTFDQALLNAIDRHARDRGITRAAFLASVARERLELGP